MTLLMVLIALACPPISFAGDVKPLPPQFGHQTEWPTQNPVAGVPSPE